MKSNKLIPRYLNGGNSESEADANKQNSSIFSSIANSQNFNPYGMAAGMLGQTIGGMFSTPNANLNANNQMSASIRNGISGALMSSGNPYAMAAGAIITGIDRTGGFTDASQGLGRYDGANKIASMTIPGAGWFTGKTDDYQMSQGLQQMSGSYGGSYNNALTAQNNAGAKLLFGRGKANRMIRKAKEQDNMIQDIQSNAQEDWLSQNTMSTTIGLRNYQQLQNNQGLARAAKFGAKLQKVQDTKDKMFFDSLELPEPQFIPKDDTDFFDSLTLVESFKQGGEFNVIPEGALHARKHNMEGAEHLTKKGIPVVSEGDGGQLDQQAEIERNEIIFRLEVTKKLEDWLEQYNKVESKSEKDSIAIKAGKLLAKEIIENTQDRTGLMDTIEAPTKLKKGGSIKERIEKLSPDKLKELEKILKYVESI